MMAQTFNSDTAKYSSMEQQNSSKTAEDGAASRVEERTAELNAMHLELCTFHAS